MFVKIWLTVLCIFGSFCIQDATGCQRLKLVTDAEASCKQSEAGQDQCKYYYCIFSTLNLLNTNYDVPCIDKLTIFTKEKVEGNEKDVMMERAGKCTGGLINALMSGTVKYFDAENVDDPSKELVVPAEPQSKCDVAMQYMKCLAAAERKSDCPVFTFP